MWVLIDNYDSFTHILHHYLLLTGSDCRVIRNDELTLAQIEALNPERLVISPGPGIPNDAGITLQAIDHFHNRIPILGVCLGHQAIGTYFGAILTHAPSPMHGKTSDIEHNGHPIFKDVPPIFTVMRYHSLSLKNLPADRLIPLAISLSDGAIMAIAHTHFPCIGLQFHPESVGTDNGMTLIRNWAGMHFNW